MTRDEAIELMGLAEVNDDAVNAAFRRLSVTCHPDSQTPDPDKWGKLELARAILRAPPPRCPTCKGQGRVRVGALTKFCTDCGGKGHV